MAGALQSPLPIPPRLLGSDLDITHTAQRGTSHYFHGAAIPMIPYAPLQHQASLVAGEERSAVICALDVDQTVLLQDRQYQAAMIKVVARLNYQEVENYLSDQTATQAARMRR